MRVFLSWSGARSRALAELLHGWLPQVIQAVEPWMSSEMEKGRKWSPEISDRLGETRLGLLCLTRENLNAPWLLFEAGALSKTRDAYVWTFLHGLSPADVEQPLAQFQHTVSEKADVRKLVHTINQVVREENEKSLPETTLDKVFDTFWPELESGLRTLADKRPPGTSEVRSDRDILEEILQLVRSEQRPSDGPISLWPEPPRASTGSERPRRVSKIAILVDTTESNAKLFVEGLRQRLTSAEFDLALAPGSDRVSKIMVRFAAPVFITDATIANILSNASDASGIHLFRWTIDPIRP